MTLSLAQDKLRYSQPQMDALSRQIQMGDLTAVLQIYEEDIKSPLRSAVGGTLLRSLFIQVQKAKVRIMVFLYDCGANLYLTNVHLTGGHRPSTFRN